MIFIEYFTCKSLDYVRDENYINEIILHLKKAKNENLFCDVIFRSGSQEVYAHRVVVSRLSGYFSRLVEYEGGFGKTAIEFDENIITGECLKNIVEFAYTGEIDISNDNLMDLLLATDYFDIQPIRKKCESYIMTLNDKMFTDENLKYFVWFAFNLNFSFLQDIVCKFISKHFVQSTDTLLSLSPYCLLMVLSDKNLTVCDNGIPVSEGELELFQLVVEFSTHKHISEEQIAALLRTIDFTEIQPEIVSSIFDSNHVLKRIDHCSRLSMLREMPFYAEQIDENVKRFLSKKIKYLTTHNPDIDIDDRICSIKVHRCERVSYFREASSLEISLELEDEDGYVQPSIAGFELTYNSGKVVTIGDISDKAVWPYNRKGCDHFILSKNEAIVEISTTWRCILSLSSTVLLSTVKFVTNYKREYCSTLQPSFNVDFHPRSGGGYFHSFHPSSTIDELDFIWVEYVEQKNKYLAELPDWSIIQEINQFQPPFTVQLAADAQ